MWVSIAILLGGILLLAAYFSLTPTPTPLSGTWVASQILNILGSILISSALISLVLSASTIHESRLQVREEIERSVGRVLSPMQEMIEDQAQRDYRWHCLLAMPADSTDLQDFGIAEIEISKEVALIPDTMRFICIAAPSDEEFRPYADDPSYFLRWVVDRTLDPSDPATFGSGKSGWTVMALRSRGLYKRGDYVRPSTRAARRKSENAAFTVLTFNSSPESMSDVIGSRLRPKSSQ